MIKDAERYHTFSWFLFEVRCYMKQVLQDTICGVAVMIDRHPEPTHTAQQLVATRA